MLYRDALARIGGLSAPSKMPCHGYSIPAKRCKLGSKLRKLPGTTCSVCYALKGFYAMASVEAALQRRMDIVDACEGNLECTAEWCEAFAVVLDTLRERTVRYLARIEARNALRVAAGRVDLLPVRPGKSDGRYFRWHDAGDLQSVWHLGAIVAVARLTPNVRHWLPTREAGIVRDYLATGGAFPSNLVVRVSAARIGELPAALYKLGLPLSGVHADALPEGFERCSAPTTANACADCRACWNPAVHVSYHAH